MPIHVLRDVDVIADGYRLRGIMNSVALADSVDVLEATVFADAARRRVAGLRSANIDMEGFYDATLDKELYDRLGVANVPITVAPDGNAEGARAFFFRAIAGEYSHGGGIGEVNPFSLNAQGSDGSRLVRGTIMHNATRTTTANGTSRQLGAIAAGQKMYAALHVLAASGTTPTLNVVVGSDDNSGFLSGVNRITFAQATAIGSQWLTLDGPITDDYWRVQWTIAGTSPSFEFVVVLGIL